jgi:hypothetical protein
MRPPVNSRVRIFLSCFLAATLAFEAGAQPARETPVRRTGTTMSAPTSPGFVQQALIPAILLAAGSSYQPLRRAVLSHTVAAGLGSTPPSEWTLAQGDAIESLVFIVLGSIAVMTLGTAVSAVFRRAVRRSPDQGPISIFSPAVTLDREALGRQITDDFGIPLSHAGLAPAGYLSALRDLLEQTRQDPRFDLSQIERIAFEPAYLRPGAWLRSLFGGPVERTQTVVLTAHWSPALFAAQMRRRVTATAIRSDIRLKMIRESWSPSTPRQRPAALFAAEFALAAPVALAVLYGINRLVNPIDAPYWTAIHFVLGLSLSYVANGMVRRLVDFARGLPVWLLDPAKPIGLRPPALVANPDDYISFRGSASDRSSPSVTRDPSRLRSFGIAFAAQALLLGWLMPYSLFGLAAIAVSSALAWLVFSSTLHVWLFPKSMQEPKAARLPFLRTLRGFAAHGLVTFQEIGRLIAPLATLLVLTIPEAVERVKDWHLPEPPSQERRMPFKERAIRIVPIGPPLNIPHPRGGQSFEPKRAQRGPIGTSPAPRIQMPEPTVKEPQITLPNQPQTTGVPQTAGGVRSVPWEKPVRFSVITEKGELIVRDEADPFVMTDNDLKRFESSYSDFFINTQGTAGRVVIHIESKDTGELLLTGSQWAPNGRSIHWRVEGIPLQAGGTREVVLTIDNGESKQIGRPIDDAFVALHLQNWKGKAVRFRVTGVDLEPEVPPPPKPPAAKEQGAVRPVRLPDLIRRAG